jgi:hypothetical protein
VVARGSTLPTQLWLLGTHSRETRSSCFFLSLRSVIAHRSAPRAHRLCCVGGQRPEVRAPGWEHSSPAPFSRESTHLPRRRRAPRPPNVSCGARGPLVGLRQKFVLYVTSSGAVGPVESRLSTFADSPCTRRLCEVPRLYVFQHGSLRRTQLRSGRGLPVKKMSDVIGPRGLTKKLAPTSPAPRILHHRRPIESASRIMAITPTSERGAEQISGGHKQEGLCAGT